MFTADMLNSLYESIFSMATENNLVPKIVAITGNRQHPVVYVEWFTQDHTALDHNNVSKFEWQHGWNLTPETKEVF